MMGGQRTPSWLILGAFAMLFALLWFFFAGLAPRGIWLLAAGFLALAIVAVLGRAAR